MLGQHICKSVTYTFDITALFSWNHAQTYVTCTQREEMNCLGKQQFSKYFGERVLCLHVMHSNCLTDLLQTVLNWMDKMKINT